jgi:deazaflavin-dependent oxidoreductase (nitroreductase family)
MEQSRHYIRPGFVLSRVVNPVIMSLGLTPTFAVRGRRSGEWRTVPVMPIEHGGSRYLVAPRGQTQWVRNLRAAGAGELRRRRRKEAFKAVEVDGAERESVVAAYRQKVSGLVRAQFEQLPDPADHPTFRLEELS